jgi:hypothetical protein
MLTEAAAPARVAAPGWRALPDWLWLALLALATRAQTFGNPFTGYDEQFYRLAGHWLLRGWVPYVDIFDRKPVGIFLIYAAAEAIGPPGPFAYQLLAAAAATGTAAIIVGFARPDANRWGALAAGAAYLLWLPFGEGEGGQTPVFYNLAVAGAALIVKPADARHMVWRGAAAMLLAGVAVQVKTAAVFEGAFLFMALLWRALAGGTRPVALAPQALLWAAAAAAPTAAVAGWYASHGAFDAWAFANIWSNLGRGPPMAGANLPGFIKMALILSPLLALACWPAERSPGRRFARLWLVASIGGILAFGSFVNTHYLLPALAPACCAAAPLLGRRRAVAAKRLLPVALIGGQVVLALTALSRGGSVQAAALAAAARLAHGPLWVFDGQPVIYLFADAPPPSRWAFPGHLKNRDEFRKSSTGADPEAEIARILALKPEVIVNTRPHKAIVEPRAIALVEGELARSYRLACAVPTRDRTLLIYRLRSDPAGCAGAVAWPRPRS